jgi:hypothetical protein
MNDGYLCEGKNCNHRINCEDEEWEYLFITTTTGSWATRPYIVEKTCPSFSANNTDDVVAETEHLVAFVERDLQ